MTKPTVTIYIPCRNYGRFLRQAVESVICQLYKEWELFIIDEASNDDTAHIAEEMRVRAPDKIKIISNQKPVGLQKVANNVLDRALGKYMIRLDADDWFDECAILSMVSKLESEPGVGIVYGNYYYTNEEGNIIGSERRARISEGGSSDHLPPHGACTMFRTRALKNAGGYSEDVDAQDGWELWHKLHKRIGAVNLDLPLFYYRQHGNSLSTDSSKMLKARTKILGKISRTLEGDYKPTVIAVIPVKESYPGFEGVPYKVVEGYSLLERAILSASSETKISSIIVTSESPNVLGFSEDLEKKGKVPKHVRLLRKTKTESSSTIPVRQFMIEAGNHFAEETSRPPDIIAYLSLHAVYRNKEHVCQALDVMRITQSDAVVSVLEEREPMFSYREQGLHLINPGRFRDLAYDQERLYRFNGSIIATWWEVLSEHDLFGEKVSFFEMTAKESYQVQNNQTDINS